MFSLLVDYPWDDRITVQTPWGIIVRARRADDQARHGRGDPQGGQFAVEETAGNPEEPKDVGVIKGRFKEYNRLRVKTAKAKRRAQEKFGSDDPGDWDEETRIKVDGLTQAAGAAKMRFNRAQKRAAGSGIRINALGKWTNSEPDGRLMREAAEVRGKISEARKRLDDYIKNDPEIEAIEAEAAVHSKVMEDAWGNVGKLHGEGVSRGYSWELDEWPDTPEAQKLKAAYEESVRTGQAAEIEYRKATGQAATLKKAAREKYFEEVKALIKPDNPVSFLPDFRDGAENFEGIRESVTETASLISWDAAMPGGAGESPDPLWVQLVAIQEGERSYFRDGWLYMGNGGLKSVSHELGHRLEYFNKGIKYKANQFLKKRAEGEELENIHNIAGEVGYRDGFEEHYAGKLYSDGDNGEPFQMNSTEIVSKGLEYMATDPIDFVETDPEYFDFIYTVLRGG